MDRAAVSVIDPAGFVGEFGEEARRRGFGAEVLVETAAGPVMAFTSPSKGEPRYLSAGIHGDEPAGPLAALELMRSGFFSDQIAWTVCPLMNPTGIAAGTRHNAEGFDLNRDYMRRSTNEVRAHAEWLAARPVPQLFFSLHEDWESSGFYFYEINLGEDCPRRAEGIIESVSPWFPPEPELLIDDHEVRSPGWIYHEARADLPDHWPEAIYLAELGCPVSFTFETPSSLVLEDRIAAHVAAVETAAS